MTRSAKKTGPTETGLSAMAAPMMAGNPVVAKAWMDIMTESARFLSDRLQQDLELQQALLRCKTPVEVAEVQAKFMQQAVEQYTEETMRMFKMMSGATEETLQTAKSGQSRGYDDVPV
ncbi:MAG: phasin family protein [Pseudomonadota bacterium]